MAIYFESPYALVYWNEILNTAVLQWVSFAQGENFRMPMDKMLELVKQQHARKIMHDNRMLPDIAREHRVFPSNLPVWKKPRNGYMKFTNRHTGYHESQERTPS